MGARMDRQLPLNACKGSFTLYRPSKTFTLLRSTGSASLFDVYKDRVLFKERTEHLLNIQNFIQRFRNQTKGIKYFINIYKCFALRIFIHQLIKPADSALISSHLREEEKVIKISALEISEKFLTPKFKHIELTVSAAK